MQLDRRVQHLAYTELSNKMTQLCERAALKYAEAAAYLRRSSLGSKMEPMETEFSCGSRDETGTFDAKFGIPSSYMKLIKPIRIFSTVQLGFQDLRENRDTKRKLHLRKDG